MTLRFNSHLRVMHTFFSTKTIRLMLLRQEIAASSDNHTKYIIALCGQNAGGFLLLRQVITIQTTEP